MALALSGCSDVSNSIPQPVPGTTLRPGLWRFVDTVVDISSAGMSSGYLNHLRQKADGHVSERCIRPGEERSLLSLTDPMRGNPQLEGVELRDGRIDARVTRIDREVTEIAVISGSYDSDHVVLISKNSATGSPNPLGNIEFTIRRVGKRIGDCPT